VNILTCAGGRAAYLFILPRRWTIASMGLLRLEQHMLDMTKIENKFLMLDKEGFEEIQNVIKDFSNELSKEKIQLVFTPPSQKEPIFVNADEVRIFEVISNLLGNAIKFTIKEAGRSITIKAEKKDSILEITISFLLKWMKK
jgi:signal transduction histidine kinase